jgi:DNA polymerase-3 subunit epsilon
MVQRAPSAADVIREFTRFIGDAPLVAHNAAFDRKFLDAELHRIRLKRRQDVACSLRVARRVYPGAPDHTLATLVRYAGVPVGGRHHRALADAEMAAALWLRMQEELRHTFGLRSVTHELMCQLQTVRRAGLVDFMEGYTRRYRS